MENGLRDVAEDASFFGREAALEHGAKHLGHHVLDVLRRGEVCRGALQGVGQFFRGAGRRGRDVVLTEGILQGETQVAAGAAITGDVLAAGAGRGQGNDGVCGGLVSCFGNHFHFGVPSESVIAKFLGGTPSRGFFCTDWERGLKRKEMGEEAYRKYGEKQWPSSAEAAAGKRVTSSERKWQIPCDAPSHGGQAGQGWISRPLAKSAQGEGKKRVGERNRQAACNMETNDSSLQANSYYTVQFIKCQQKNVRRIADISDQISERGEKVPEREGGRSKRRSLMERWEGVTWWWNLGAPRVPSVAHARRI